MPGGQEGWLSLEGVSLALKSQELFLFSLRKYHFMLVFFFPHIWVSTGLSLLVKCVCGIPSAAVCEWLSRGPRMSLEAIVSFSSAIFCLYFLPISDLALTLSFLVRHEYFGITLNFLTSLPPKFFGRVPQFTILLSGQIFFFLTLRPSLSVSEAPYLLSEPWLVRELLQGLASVVFLMKVALGQPLGTGWIWVRLSL